MGLLEDRIAIIDASNPIQKARRIGNASDLTESLDGPEPLDRRIRIGRLAAGLGKNRDGLLVSSLGGSNRPECVLGLGGWGLGAIGRILSDAPNPPDSPAGPIPIRMVQRDLVVPDDLVVEIRNIQTSIGAELKVDGSKPRILAGQEVGQLDGFGRRSEVLKPVAIDPAGHDVAANQIPSKARRERCPGDVSDSGNGRTPMQVFHRRRDKPESIMRATETRIASTSKQLRDRFAMAIRRKPKPILVPGHPKRIDLSLGVQLHSASIGPESKNVPAGHLDRMAVGPLNFRNIVKAMAGVDPAVLPVAQRIDHPVRIARRVEWSKDHLALVAYPIPIGIPQMVEIGDRKGDHAVLVRQ